jgi:hypothetical protein
MTVAVFSLPNRMYSCPIVILEQVLLGLCSQKNEKDPFEEFNFYLGLSV